MTNAPRTPLPRQNKSDPLLTAKTKGNDEMKTMKKTLALLIVAMMIVAMLPNALAADSYKITITNAQAGHTYTAYQVFSGDLTLNGTTKILSNIVFGNGVSEAGKTNLLAFNSGTYTDAAELAEALNDGNVAAFAKLAASAGNLSGTNTSMTQTAAGDCYIENLAPGYYLVIDSYTSSEGNKSDALSNYMIMVVGDATMGSKHSYPTLDKQILHNELGSWGVVGDNQIGDTVEFRTITTVPDTTGYTTYDYIISDTMSTGLTSNVVTGNTNKNVSIKVDDTTPLEASYYTVSANSNQFTVTVDILKAVKDGKISANSKLYTYYTGVLNGSALIYDEGKQQNAAYLEYSNNPNDNTSKGKTPEIVVYDWTFKMGVNKVDESKASLTGAKFVLSESGSMKVADMNCSSEGIPSDTTGLISLVKIDDSTYRIATSSDTSTTFVIEAGNVTIRGLDDATDYYLYETLAPAGYNLVNAPVHFRISCNYNANGSAVDTDNPTVTVDNGAPSTTLSTNVVNKSGASLPSTGGMGTTIFYIVGSILVIGAVVLLVSKKRMNAAE